MSRVQWLFGKVATSALRYCHIEICCERGFDTTKVVMGSERNGLMSNVGLSSLVQRYMVM